MKTFIAHSFPKLKRIDSDGGRTYETPTGNCYPSVTSVVGLHKAKFIQEWRARVGEKAANKISSKASKRGTAIHSLCEDYLLGNELNVNPFDHEMFTSLKPHLDKIDNIHCLETQLYSHHLEVAGTVDCIAEYDGKLCVIDFKTSSKPKPKDWIHDYFMQTSAYAVMFEEMTGISVGRLLIVMGVDDHEPLIFQEKRNDWIGQFRSLRSQYKEIKGN
jgi:CRISPR/Cas system-associated exonuclease Cas4 (RecB family)